MFADEFQHVHMNENKPVLFRCYWVTFFMQQAVTCFSFFPPHVIYRWFPSFGSQDQCSPIGQGLSSSQNQPPAVQEERF